MLTPYELASLAVTALDDKKAQDIKLLRTSDVTVLADYFAICTASSRAHLKTLSDNLEVELKKVSENPHRREGDKSNEWMLIDYGCLVVHIFLENCREFYKLEHLWSDAESMDITEILEKGQAQKSKLPK